MGEKRAEMTIKKAIKDSVTSDQGPGGFSADTELHKYQTIRKSFFPFKGVLTTLESVH